MPSLIASSLAVGPPVLVPVLAVALLTTREILLYDTSLRSVRAVRLLTLAAWPATIAAAAVLLLRFLQLV